MPHEASSLVRVYAFGCRDPGPLAPEADAQLRLQRDFWNGLVEIERRARHRLPGEQAAANAQTARIAAVAAARRWYATKGLYWGNANAVLASYRQARLRSHRDAGRLHPQPYTGEGRWTVQIQTERHEPPFRVADLFGYGSRPASQVGADPVDWTGWDRIARAERRRRARTRVRLRIGSRGRAPVWLELDAALHRPVPADAAIVQAAITRRHIGPGWRYTFQLTVRESAPPPPPPRPTVAVDLTSLPLDGGGWQVAVARGGPEPLEVCTPRLPAPSPYTLSSGLERCRRLQDRRTRLHAEASAMLAAWLKHAGSATPAWLRPPQTGTGAGRAHLIHLVDHWRPFAGDAQVHARLRRWRRRDRRLAIQEAGLRHRWQLRRREAYRVAAARIAASAGGVVLRLDGPVRPGPAAQGLFRRVLEEACLRRGVAVRVAAANRAGRTITPR